MPGEEREKEPDRLEFQEIREPVTGRLLFRLSRLGIIEVKQKNSRPVLIDITPYLDVFRR